LANTIPTTSAAHLVSVALSNISKWIRPVKNANTNMIAKIANAHILIYLFLLIPEYKYIPYGSQTFLEKKDLIPVELDMKGEV
jgi:hypothetical protein